jgi:hypothetical protein
VEIFSGSWQRLLGLGWEWVSTHQSWQRKQACSNPAFIDVEIKSILKSIARNMVASSFNYSDLKYEY